MRKLSFSLATIVLVIAVIELASAALLWRVTGAPPSPSTLSAEREQLLVMKGAEPHREAGLIVAHPYLGFSLDPEQDTPQRAKFHDGLPISEWGFMDSAPPIRRRSDDTLILGIFGGSVAHWLSTRGIDALIDELEKSGAYPGREIVLVRTAMGGYKQPQQLLALTYVLAAGGEFDIVINLDGYNEVTLPAAHQVPQGVFPLYPAQWQMVSDPLPSPKRLALMGRVAHHGTRRAALAKRVESLPVRWSMTANLLWWLRDRSLERRRADAQLGILALEKEAGRRYRTHGPERSYPSREAMFADFAETWRRSSLQMHHLAAANGAVYLHFLQPNQHVPGSKPMSDAERAVAVGPFEEHADSVTGGYPHLRSAGRELVEAGVEFHDLVELFQDEPRPLYVDDCCHLNELGNELLGREIGLRIAAGHRQTLGAAVSR